ncbi:peptidase [Microbacterium protaetiae]|uniref:Peptidase n=1 Tax=Microbacterium protaetiae TaxID=2509458 RepID=A0A4P6ET67_9MICO|nr:Trp biosynthesis-associated membrane protein [Microbacterium protaetiae]QAY61228.1 peptidase [Microbacterium protaetiae]
MMARARTIAVVVIMLCGAGGVLSSTQTWLHVSLTGAASDALTVTGAAAVPVLAPLSLAVLALGLALSIVGRVLRYIFGAIAVAAAVILGIVTVRVAFGLPISAVARTVTDATGITGDEPVSHLVSGITATAWPMITVILWVVLLAVGVFVIATAHRWSTSGRKYRTDNAAHAPAAGTLDAVDSWDDLSRGADPTAGEDRR